MSANHLKALLKKNYILHKRNKIGSCLEILIPVFFAWAFVYLKNGRPDIYFDS